MRRAILFCLVGCVIVAAGWLLAGVPGHVDASVGPVSFQASTPIAILALVAFIVAILILIGILRWLIAMPGAGARWRAQRRKAAGERSVTRSLVALAAGEQDSARKEARRARALLGDSPRTLMLSAEASRLAGREDEAEQAYRALAKRKDAQFLGLRGLLRQAVDRRDWADAGVLARQAEASHPGTAWLRQQRAELALQNDDWSQALELIGADPHRPTYYVAAADAEPNPARALDFARRACKQDPTFTPAAIAYASRLRALGYEMRAQSYITEAWKGAPHPDLAAFALEPQTDKLARALIADRLAARNPTHPESRILLARVALDAGMTREARRQIELAGSAGIQESRLWLLLAEIEELEHGDTEAGRRAQREALRRAAATESDPHWQCISCHTDHTAWHPKCPACGRVATIQWVRSQGASNLPLIAG